MIVDERYRDNVGYVIDRSAAKNPTPIGTVFFVQFQTEELLSCYAVTCAHVVNPYSKGVQSPLFIRVNTVSGCCDISCPRERWTVSKDSDVAVIEVSIRPGQFPEDAKIWAYPLEYYHLISNACVGQSVFMTGLFSPVPGSSKVEALVRLGSVAREHCEVAVTVNCSKPKDTKTTDVCLIQAMGWEGESGSPVFVYEPKQEFRSGVFVDRVETVITPTLIGMLHGHFPLYGKRNSQNSGIAIVIREKDIWDTLSLGVLVKRRELALAELKTQNMPRIIPASSK
jgi:hypothetical protein